MYDADVADVYHRFYRARRGKDYAAEVAEMAALIRDRRPGADSLLDVACGTGSHLEHFAREFDDVAGLELSEAMLALARPALPGVALHQGDMRDFSLGRRFTAMTCMFSSIGYLSDTAELDATLACCAEHLEPGGVLIIEPWWTPDRFIDRYVAGDVVTVDGQTIARVSHTVRDGRTTRMEIHWVVADPANGPRHVVQEHLLTLFERAEYEKAFAQAGLDVEHVSRGPSSPGWLVGVRR